MKKTINAATYINIVLAVTAATSVAEDAEEKAGYLGVTVAKAVSDRIKGPYVKSIEADGPAERAGMRKYDVILAIGDTPIPDGITYMETIASLPPGKEVQLKIWRKDKEFSIKATLGGRPLFNTNLLQEDPPRALGGTYDASGNVGALTGEGNVIVHRGRVHVKGRFEQHWRGVLDIHIDRRKDYPHVRVDGDVYLAGILYVGISKIEPRPGDRFELISDAKSLRGRFGKVMLPEFKDVQGKIVYDDLEKKQDLDGDGKYDVTLVFEAAKDTPK